MSVTPTLGRLTLAEAAWMLQGLYLADLEQLRNGARGILSALPPVMHGSRERRLIRYVRRDENERWQTIRDLWANGGGDCEDLAAAVAAELTFKGTPARPVIRRVRPGLAHAVVQIIATGQILDPSKLAGMGSQGERREHAGGLKPGPALAMAALLGVAPLEFRRMRSSDVYAALRGAGLEQLGEELAALEDLGLLEGDELGDDEGEILELGDVSGNPAQRYYFEFMGGT